MVETAYSDERAEAFRAYMCLYGYKAAIDRCDWVAARRWFSEKEGERSRATARWALFCVAFATAYMVLHISMPQLVEEVPRPLRNVMEAVALTSVFAGALTLLRFKEETFDAQVATSVRHHLHPLRCRDDRRVRPRADTAMERPSRCDGFH